MSTQQPKALRLADELTTPHMEVNREAAAELRRLHSVNAELLDALKLARLVVNPAHAYGIAIEAAIAKATGEQA
jgi:hypothetical protein